MIRLFKVKEKQRELAESANGGAPIKKQSAGELRLHKGSLIHLVMTPFFFLILVFLWQYIFFIYCYSTVLCWLA